MSRMHVEDDEFGRGRRNDSSSSRESSPRQAKKRSFSPTSDDGDLVVPPIASDDTPPPPERPLLRQPVAFAWSSSTYVAADPTAFNTYQANLPTATASSGTYFLPGQEVALPPPPLPRRRKRKTDGPSKKRKINDYSGQTSRFRLKPYDPSAEPPFQERILLSGTPADTSTASSESTFVSYRGVDDRSSSFQALTQEPIVESRKEAQVTKNKSKQSTNDRMPSITKWKVTDFVPQGSSRVSPATTKRPSPPVSRRLSPPANRPSSNDSTVLHNRGHGYYRRDYEQDSSLRASEPTHSSSHHAAWGHSQGSDPGPSTSRSVSHNPHKDASSIVLRPHEGGVRTETRRSQKALMLTLLIQDIRSGVTDHQLAEVKLPMKPANDQNEGFWADAKLLGQQLQSSASRIDGKRLLPFSYVSSSSFEGPAKVYTLRGKYRQFFLRVTAENVDEFISTHLAINPDRMLDVVVEALLPPGQLPLPPRIPRDLIKSPTPESTSGSPTPERETFQELPFERQRNHDKVMRDFEEFRRLQRSLEHDRSRSGSPQSVDGGRKSRKDKVRGQKQKRNAERRSKSPEPMSPASTSTAPPLPIANMRFDSPDLNDSPAEVHRLVSEAVDQIIQEDDGWIEFFQAKAALQPHRALDVLKQYRFVKRMIDEWVGRRAPFRSFHISIEPSHITQALKIDEPNFASACLETLALLDLYGPEGRHYEDSRVTEMMNDTSRPEYNAKPIKRLLHSMRDIDKKWKEEHSGESKSSGAQSESTGDFTTMRG